MAHSTSSIMFRLRTILEQPIRARFICMYLSYGFLCFFMKVFYLKRIQGRTTITTSNSRLKYVQALVYILFHAYCVAIKMPVSFSGRILQENFYNVPLYVALVFSAIYNYTSFLRNDHLLLEVFKRSDEVDEMLILEFSHEPDYKHVFTLTIPWALYAFLCGCEVILHYFAKIPLVLLALHTFSIVTAIAITVLPLLINQVCLFYAYRKGNFLELQIRKISSVELRKYVIIHKLNCAMKANSDWISIVNMSNRVCSLAIVIALYIVFYSCLYVCIFMNTVEEFEELIDIELFALGFVALYCVIIILHGLFNRQQQNIANAIIEFVNPTKDPEIDLARRNFLQQLLHQKIDSSGCGMFDINPALLLTIVKSLTTGTMFIFRIFPQLLDNSL